MGNSRDVFFFWWEVFWHGAADFLDGFADDFADVIMCFCGGSFADFLAGADFVAEFVVGLSNAEEVGGEFGGAGAVEDFVFAETFLFADFFTAHAVEAEVAGVVKSPVIFYAAFLGGFEKLFVPVCDLLTSVETFFFAGHTVELLLAESLDVEIALSEGDGLFGGVTVLGDEVAGIAREAVVRNIAFGAFPCWDHFPDFKKMIFYVVICICRAVFERFFGAVDGFFEVFPFIVTEGLLKVSCAPEFVDGAVRLFQIVEND